MTGKLSAGAALKLAELEEFDKKVQRVHGLVEQFATSRSGTDTISATLKRSLGRLKTELMSAGLDAMSQLAAGLEIAAGRGMSQSTKRRILREGVASLRFQVEMEQRSVRQAELKAQEAAEARDGG